MRSRRTVSNIAQGKLKRKVTSLLRALALIGTAVVWLSGCRVADSPGPSLPSAAQVRHVVIVSLDGGGSDMVRASDMPVLSRMITEGAHTWEAQTVFPSITLVAHTSMLTGLDASEHKVNWNSWRPRVGRLPFPSVFSLAAERGMKTALIAGKMKFLHLADTNVTRTVILEGLPPEKFAQAAADFIRAEKPAVCVIHFAHGDSAGHKYGWGSGKQRATFARIDKGLGMVSDAMTESGLWNDTVMLITADHGGHDTGHGLDIPSDMTIPWIAVGAGVNPDHTIKSAVSVRDTAATTLWLLGIPMPRTEVRRWSLFRSIPRAARPVTEAFVRQPEPASDRGAADKMESP